MSTQQSFWQRSMTNRKTGRSFEHPLGFWLGVMLTTTGVLLQLPMYFMAADDHYMLAGMPLTSEMNTGMLMIVFGFAVALWSVFPKKPAANPELSRIRIAALDDAKLKQAHVALLPCALMIGAALKVEKFEKATLGGQEARSFTIDFKAGAGASMRQGKLIGYATLRHYGAIFLGCVAPDGLHADAGVQKDIRTAFTTFQFTGR